MTQKWSEIRRQKGAPEPSGEHRCAAPGCTVEVPGYMLACARHWRALPEPLQSRIRRAWQLRRRHPDDEVLAAAHLDTVVEAMQVWSAA
jgi:hypothetical protein